MSIPLLYAVKKNRAFFQIIDFHQVPKGPVAKNQDSPEPDPDAPTVSLAVFRQENGRVFVGTELRST